VTEREQKPAAWPFAWATALAMLTVSEAFVGSWLSPVVERLKGRHGPYDAPAPLIANPTVDRLGDAYEIAFGRDGRRYRLSRGLIAETDDGRRLWSFNPSGGLSNLVLGPDETVYVVYSDLNYMGGNNNSTLLAFTPSGEQAWEWVPPPGQGRSSSSIHDLSVDEDGVIYIAGETVWAIQPDGTVKWGLTPDRFMSSLTVKDGFIFGSSILRAADGHILWDSAEARCGPYGFLVQELTICAGSELVAYGPDGGKHWRAQFERTIFSRHSSWAPPVAIGNLIVIAAGGLHAVDSTGQRRWTYRPIDYLTARPVIAGHAIVAAGRHNVVALNADGKLLWRVPTLSGDESGNPPTLTTDLAGNVVAVQGGSAIRIRFPQP
jgi:outer membrane protein assembly factor BamB